MNGLDDAVPAFFRELRERDEKVLEQREVYKLQTVDHGQIVKYLGD